VVIGRNPALVYDFCEAQVIACAIAGELYVAESPSKDVIGVALWFGPGREMFDSDDQNEAALIPFMNKLSPELQQWWSEIFIHKYGELTTTALGAGTKLNAWHLQLIGVVPEEWRKGVASALIDHICEKGDGVLLCLEAETETNVSVCERLGFAVKGQKMTFTNAHGSFPMWAMAKRPGTG